MKVVLPGQAVFSRGILIKTDLDLQKLNGERRKKGRSGEEE